MDVSVAVLYKREVKIIAGKWGGQSVPGKPSPKLRPTSDKVKEAIFNQLSAKWVEDWSSLRCLDLFAGTGSLGIEALSRGAGSVVFVDHHLAAARQLETTLADFGVKEQAEVICKGVYEGIRWLEKRGDRFDLIFLDPPYREDWVVATLNVLLDHPILTKRGLVVAEQDKREVISTAEGYWKTEGARRYGDTAVTFLSPFR